MANMEKEVAQFNTTQLNAMKQFNATQENAAEAREAERDSTICLQESRSEDQGARKRSRDFKERN